MLKHERLIYSKPINRNEFWVDSSKIDEDISFINHHQIDSLIINSLVDFKLVELNFLEKVPGIKHLSIISETITNFEGVFSLEYLISLFISDLPKNIFLDFKHNSRLVELNIPSAKIINLEQLQNLTLRKFDLKKNNFENFKNIKRLILIQCSGVSDLSFLNVISNLVELEISYMPKLISINGIEHHKNTIQLLSLTNCKGILDLDIISQLINLKKLIVDNAGVF